MTMNRILDGSAVCLSGLCLAHCLVLPVAAALLPVLGAWAEAEWVHILFVVIAAPLSGLALLQRPRQRAHTGRIFLLAAGGMALLASGAFLANSRTMETGLTVVGSLCLAGAHLWNWRSRVTRGSGMSAQTNSLMAPTSQTGDL
jgi:hypothetical protein